MVPKALPPAQSSSFPVAADLIENSPVESELPSQIALRSGTEGQYFYLHADARQKLPNYQYRGADLSLLYRYILSPLATWCVDNLVPKTIAPNSITLFGLVWMMTAYFTYWYYVPSLDILSLSDDENDVVKPCNAAVVERDTSISQENIHRSLL